MTSNDRHATHNSPYRTGQHVPISQGRHAPLSSVSTNAAESQHDLSSPYRDDSKRPSITSTGMNQSPTRPYSPGMRSVSSTQIPSVDDVVSPGEIQMQSFGEGGPPAPPVSHSWKRIDAWAEKHYTELYDQLGEGCTQNDVNELEHELDLSLPQDVRDSLAIHDGQERGGRPTGIIFGCMLLDCEEIVQEWNNWKTVNEGYLNNQRGALAHPVKTSNQAASSSTSRDNQANKHWRQELLDRQDSQPPGAVLKAYAHPGWIALARDWGGNNIAIDLAPGPAGKWGQVILFGRDYDCKYVIARSWAHFMAFVADDLASGKAFVDEDSGELKLKEFKSETVEPPYMDILRWRADQKYGRRRTHRNSRNPPGLNTATSGSRNKGSPYGSPVGGDDRGRSPQRFARISSSSPRHTISSPLARVQEEIAQPQPLRHGGDVIKDFAVAEEEEQSLQTERLVEPPITTSTKQDKLVDAPTPTTAGPAGKGIHQSGLPSEMVQDDDKENTDIGESRRSTEKGEIKGLGVDALDGEMKNVSI